MPQTPGDSSRKPGDNRMAPGKPGNVKPSNKTPVAPPRPKGK